MGEGRRSMARPNSEARVEIESEFGRTEEVLGIPPVKPQSPPEAKDSKWAQSAIDRFILAKLEQKGVQPAKPADKMTLLRRVTFDLTGLPPTEEEIKDFVADTSPGAYAKVVDRLLASPRYGEKWGRHWLDVARYADSTGMMKTIDIRMPGGIAIT